VKLIKREFDDVGQGTTLSLDNFEQNLRLLSLEFITEVMFNHRLRCMDPRTRDPRVLDFVNAVDRFFIGSGRLLFSNSLWKYWTTQTWKEFEESGSFLLSEIHRYIKEAHYELQTVKSDKLTILNQFIISMDRHGHELKDIVGIMNDMLMAAVDTVLIYLKFLLIRCVCMLTLVFFLSDSHNALLCLVRARSEPGCARGSVL
jgi:hypothetical protein